MIEGAPASLDLRACITMEQVEELAANGGWTPDDKIQTPVIVYLDAEYEVIKMHVLENAQRSPMAWIQEFALTWGAMVELCYAMIVVCEVEAIIPDDTQTGEVILTDDGVTQTCVGHRHDRLRMIGLFDKQKPTEVLSVSKSTDIREWGATGEVMCDVIEAFERLMVNGL